MDIVVADVPKWFGFPSNTNMAHFENNKQINKLWAGICIVMALNGLQYYNIYKANYPIYPWYSKQTLYL